MAIKTISDLSIDEFKSLIKNTIVETLAEMMADPDRGLELTPTIKQQLKESVAALETGTETIPADKLAADLGLEW